jgi:hypothetical protein
MADDGSELKSAFLRQRRNLMLGSITLLFIELAQLKVKSDISILGIGFHIQHPEVMPLFLWAAVVYWAIRFYQYQQVSAAKFFSTVRERVRNLLTSYTTDNLQTIYPKHDAPFKLEKDETPRYELSECYFTRYGIASCEVRITPTFQALRRGSVQRSEKLEEIHARLGPKAIWGARIQAYSRFVLKMPLFTEHLLPYVLFFIPILVKLFHMGKAVASG